MNDVFARSPVDIGGAVKDFSPEEENAIALWRDVGWAFIELKKEAWRLAKIPFIDPWDGDTRPPDNLLPDGPIAEVEARAEKWLAANKPKNVSPFLYENHPFLSLRVARESLAHWENTTRERIEAGEENREGRDGEWLRCFEFIRGLYREAGTDNETAFEAARYECIFDWGESCLRLGTGCLDKISTMFAVRRVETEMDARVASAEAEMYKAQGRFEAEAEARKREADARERMEEIARREAEEKARWKAVAKTGKAFAALAGKLDFITDKAAEILDRQKGAENSRTRDGDLLEAIRRYDMERGAGNDAKTASDVIDDLRDAGMRLPIQPKTLQNRHAEWVGMGRPETLAEYQQGKAAQAAKRKKDRKARKARKAKKAGRK